jgi:hypothetical protein
MVGSNGRNILFDEYRPASRRWIQSTLSEPFLHVHSNLTLRTDWAYVENWCRKLTSSYADVFVFTVPLYLSKLDVDGKSRVVSLSPKYRD